MAAVSIKNVFPCATAPFGTEGASRLFTETNISSIFSFIFDVDSTSNYCIISSTGKYMVFNGYMFTAADGQTFTKNTTYYIIITANNELYYDETNHTALYNSQPDVSGLVGATIKSATAQKIKFI